MGEAPPLTPRPRLERYLPMMDEAGINLRNKSTKEVFDILTVYIDEQNKKLENTVSFEASTTSVASERRRSKFRKFSTKSPDMTANGAPLSPRSQRIASGAMAALQGPVRMGGKSPENKLFESAVHRLKSKGKKKVLGAAIELDHTVAIVADSASLKLEPEEKQPKKLRRSSSVTFKSTINTRLMLMLGAGGLQRKMAPFIQHHVMMEHKTPCDSRIIPMEGAVCFIDISGFTQLTQALLQFDTGTEKLSKILNTFFGFLTSIVQVKYHGSVVQFIGDAILAFFQVKEGMDMRLACRIATQCSLDIQEWVGSVVSLLTNDIKLGVTTVISCGPVYSVWLGGVAHRFGCKRWHSPLMGTAMNLLKHLDANKRRGEVVLDKEAWIQMGGGVEADLEGTEIGNNCMLLVRADFKEIPPPIPEVKQAYEEASLDYSQQFVSQSLVAVLKDSMTDVGWLAELRNLTVMFLTFPDWDNIDITADGNLDLLQKAVVAIQEIVFRFEGAIDKLHKDDKGLVMIVVFGLPQMAHEDDAERAVRCSASILERLHGELSLRVMIGLSSGPCFCGCVGSTDRCDYTVLGDTVNRSARLMASVPNGDGMRLDQATFDASQKTLRRRNSTNFGDIDFLQEDDLALKGMVEPVKNYTITRLEEGELEDEEDEMGEDALESNIVVFGLDDEIAEITNLLNDVSLGSVKKCVLVSGEIGTGKTRLASKIRSICVEDGSLSNVMVLNASCWATESKVPYFVVWHLINEEFDLHKLNSMELRERMKELGLNEQQLRDFSMILLTEEPEDAEMKVRIWKVMMFVVVGLLKEQGISAILINIDNIDAIDPWSWESVMYLWEELQSDMPDLGMMLYLSGRDLKNQVIKTGIETLDNDPETMRFTLGPLSSLGSQDYAKYLLRVSELDEDIVALLDTKICGNALFLEHTLVSLMHQDMVTFDTDMGILTENFNEGQISLSVKDLIVSRFDKLIPGLQRLLKECSVFGETIDVEILHKINTRGKAMSWVLSNLHALVATKFLCLMEYDDMRASANQRNEAPAFVFDHVMTQTVIYDLLLTEQKAEIHYNIGKAMQERMKASGKHDPDSARLVEYHLSKASDVQNDSAEYKEAAAEFLLGTKTKNNQLATFICA